MTNLKNKLKDQNARLIQVTQEKARLESKVKRTDQMIDNGISEDMTEFDYKLKEKEKVVVELKERLQKLKEKVKQDVLLFIEFSCRQSIQFYFRRKKLNSN